MITIQKKEKIEKGWKFVVSINGDRFDVKVDKKYWEKLTNRKEDSEELVRRSFEFLLAP